MKKQSSLLLEDEVAEIQVNYSPRVKNKDRIKVIQANTAEQLFRQAWDSGRLELQESFKVMLLNRNNQLLGIVTVAEGGITQTQVDMRLVIGIILKSAAVGVIFAHNHPSGNCTPSESDFALQRKVEEQCKFFDILVLDHMILTADSFYSFTESRVHAN